MLTMGTVDIISTASLLLLCSFSKPLRSLPPHSLFAVNPMPCFAEKNRRRQMGMPNSYHKNFKLKDTVCHPVFMPVLDQGHLVLLSSGTSLLCLHALPLNQFGQHYMLVSSPYLQGVLSSHFFHFLPAPRKTLCLTILISIHSQI